MQKMMYHNPEVLHAFLNHLTEAIIVYAGYQIENGAQVIQLFDSWAHHLSPEQVRGDGRQEGGMDPGEYCYAYHNV